MLYSFSHTKTQKKRLPLSVNLAGYFHAQEPVVRTSHFPLFQLIYCVDGTGEFLLNGKKCLLHPGQMVLTYPFESHSYHAVTDVWHVHIIGFSGTCCKDILTTCKMHQSGIYHFQDSDIFRIHFKKILDIIEKINLENKKKNLFAIELSKICYDLLMDLSVSVHYIGSSTPVSENTIIKTLISYMEDHYQEPVTLDLLSEQVNLCRSYISDLFKKEMKQTIIQYLNNLRISQARILLVENPEIKAGEIGHMCGFENPAYFGETFKKIVGMSPGEYRKTN